VCADKVVVLLASLSWCRPCKKVLPQYNKLAAVYSEAIFLRFNGNENEDTKALFKTKLKARVTPSFFFFKAGELLGTCTGANATRFETNLRSHLPANAMPAEMLYPEEAPVAA